MIALVVVLTVLLVLLLDLRTLIGLYAFGALLALALVHASLIRLRFRLPGATRRFRVPLSIPIGGGSLPIPTLVAGLASIAGWGIVVAAHGNAGIVGGLWMLAGLTLYVTTRRRAHLPLRGAVTVPKTVLSRDTDHGEFGSILVPVFGRKLDDDIVQSAGRLARDRALDVEESGGAQIEAIWVFEIPMSLPLGSAVDEDRLKAARAALARAKAVGEEYEGVGVATATVRARRAGQGIVEEARRRGVDVIVMAAESRHGCEAAQPTAVPGTSQAARLGQPPATCSPTRHAACCSPRPRWATAPSLRTTAERPTRKRSRFPRMFVLVLGAGRVGERVARFAMSQGHTVSVLDEDPLALDRLDAGVEGGWESAGGRFAVGTALESAALEAGRHL